MKKFVLNLKVKTKLILSFGIIIFMLLLTMLQSILSLKTISFVVNTVATDGMPLMTSALSATNAMQDTETYLYRAMLADSDTERNKYVTDAKKSADTLSSITQSLKNSSVGSNQMIANAISIIEQTLNDENAIFDLLSNGKPDEAYSLMWSSYIPRLAQVKEAFNSEIGTLKNDVGNYSGMAETATTIAYIISILIAGFSVGFSIYLCLTITKQIITPLMQIDEAANKIAQGDLKNIVIDYESKDEFGDVCNKMRLTAGKLKNYIDDIDVNLAKIADGDFNTHTSDDFCGEFIKIKNSIEKISYSLNNVLKEINVASIQLTSGSETISNGSHILSESAGQQSYVIENLTKTMDDISAEINNNADNSKTAEKISQDTMLNVDNSNKCLNAMSDAMEEINKKSTEIEKIIKVIDDIAFQTNILALNAAIEAARAGTAGVGFAVVADEVRNLASKSAESAKNTSSLIEQTIAAVETGSTISNETVKSINLVVDGTKDMANIISEIAKASSRQADAVATVAENIKETSLQIAHTSEISQESARAGVELNSQAQNMMQIVGKFKLIETQKN